MNNAILSITIVFKWHKTFKGCRENVEDKHHSGRPILSTNMEVVRTVITKFHQHKRNKQKKQTSKKFSSQNSNRPFAHEKKFV